MAEKSRPLNPSISHFLKVRMVLHLVCLNETVVFALNFAYLANKSESKWII